jgi:hypothetical protein
VRDGAKIVMSEEMRIAAVIARDAGAWNKILRRGSVMIDGSLRRAFISPTVVKW